MRTSEKLGSIQSQTSIEKKMARPVVVDYYSGEPPTNRRRKHCYTRALVSLADIMLNEKTQTPDPFTCGSGPAMVTVRKTLAAGRGILMEGGLFVIILCESGDGSKGLMHARRALCH